MENLEKILYDRLIKGESKQPNYSKEYKITKDVFKSEFSSIKKCLENYSDKFTVRSYKLFKSKVDNDSEIYKWNEKYRIKKYLNKNKKEYVFSNYCTINNKGKSVKEDEKISDFFSHLKEKYEEQTKEKLENQLKWISSFHEIEKEEHICYYCGISEKILTKLYKDPKYTCKTKRNRGEWFELDRQNAKENQNVYSKENIVLCCYFCNNHKSDVISPEDMRNYFGEKMFNFLISQFNKLSKNN